MVTTYPFAVLVLSLLVLSLSAWVGATRFPRLQEQLASMREEFSVIVGATLTLLGLIIGFTFAMAVGRYDQRKNYEEEEANAIGTEYLRAELLPAADAARVRALLVSYLDERILFYTTNDHGQIAQIDRRTTRLQSQLWSAVKAAAAAQPTPPITLAAAGMNDVINTQGYTQAAWWNRIPITAWALMAAIAICTTMLVGVGARKEHGFSRMLLVLPVVVSIAFFLIADIDSPRHGMIRVVPMNLLSLAESLRSP